MSLLRAYVPRWAETVEMVTAELFRNPGEGIKPALSSLVTRDPFKKHFPGPGVVFSYLSLHFMLGELRL